jgi:hypothetical protein
MCGSLHVKRSSKLGRQRGCEAAEEDASISVEEEEEEDASLSESF